MATPNATAPSAQTTAPARVHAVRSILDTDLYKLTMQQAVLKHYPDANVSCAFQAVGSYRFIVTPDSPADKRSLPPRMYRPLHEPVGFGDEVH